MCEKCQDTGFVISVKNGMTFAQECECMEIARAKERLILSGISEEFRKKSFDTFTDRGKDVLRDAKKAAMDYCNNFLEIRSNRHNSILYMGQVGSGKTHLSMAICNYLMDNYGVGVLYMPYREEITKIKQSVLDEEAYKKLVNKYKTCSALMIDDLLKGKNTEADVNILFDIINYRYINNLPMIISTEKTTAELLDFDEGTMSRVIEMSRDYMVEIVGRQYNYRIG